MTPPLVCAHRGASARLQDNSIEAFQAALEMGAEMIETDVRRGRDGDLVLSHGRPALGSQPVRLEQLVELAGGRIALDLELKEPGLESDLLRIVDPRPPGLIVTSFLSKAIELATQLDPDLVTGLLAHPSSSTHYLPTRAARCGARLVGPHYSLVDDTLRAWALSEGRPLVVWTVNDPDQLRELLSDPAVGIVITDEPELARGLRDAPA